ncbi:MAG: pyridoxamine 5'-phosphate oxidase [Hyphomicrobiaceae bacterium]
MLTSDLSHANDPYDVFEAWLGEAQDSEPNDPNAMALATVDAGGLPNVRMVLLKGLDEKGANDRGFVFYTNFESEKGKELLASGKAGLLFHWKSLRRQIKVRGRVSPVTSAEADDYFETRPRGSRIGAWASDQSRPLQSREVLEAKVDELTKQYGDKPIPRPSHWSGFRVVPLQFEFWDDGEFRLHDRIVFHRSDVKDGWQRERLYP